MPQLSPLPWVFSFIMIIMLIVSMSIVYFIMSEMVMKLNSKLVKSMKWCW
uniref:ATP synthase F0 subunit 8 n=1 Tax=Austrarchaea sp. WA_1 TaxID=1090241 RepID=H2E4V2_9ARAC|nr:ATP synthase F0 subunit 8 [Austrarchaea sp. WA_1]AEX89208.1 ATP synthase F0 subunit 8 [Austrarchaea sp. WA_1]AEX89211.1 ATP synthase F0 subunit 8 [Austrarchaea sp. WA_1]AEX89214.1 ATP synthase F0 subunit 8 [Austrarchaea sp. WA_1]